MLPLAVHPPPGPQHRLSPGPWLRLRHHLLHLLAALLHPRALLLDLCPLRLQRLQLLAQGIHVLLGRAAGPRHLSHAALVSALRQWVGGPGLRLLYPVRQGCRQEGQW